MQEKSKLLPMNSIDFRPVAAGNPQLGPLLDEYSDLLSEYFQFRVDNAAKAGQRYNTFAPTPTDFDGTRGVYLIALDNGNAAGCGGVRTLGGTVWEVKNVWVRPKFRGKGVAKALMTELENWARAHEAIVLRLDTHESLTAAIGLYRSLGFVEIPPYNENPNASLWFEKTLSARHSPR